LLAEPERLQIDMATFMHVTDARIAASVQRSGLKPFLTKILLDDGAAQVHRAVYCVPVVANFQATFQWLRELKRAGYRTAVGVQFRIPDRQEVFFGKFNKPHLRLSAAEAIGLYMKSPDQRGLEVLVPRRVTAREILRVRNIPQLIGWRFFPESKNTGTIWLPWKGAIKRRRVLASLNRREDREYRDKS
jgi:hypothetical protein